MTFMGTRKTYWLSLVIFHQLVVQILSFIILLLFGKRLPDLMGSLGRSIVEFKKGAREVEGPVSDDVDRGHDAES